VIPNFPKVPSQALSFTDYITLVQQSGTSFLEINKMRQKSLFLVAWKIRYAENLLQSDFNKLRAVKTARAILKSWRQGREKKLRMAQQHAKMKEMKAFYSLFKDWARSNRQLVYEQIKTVRQFRLRISMAAWKKYLEMTGFEVKKTRVADDHYYNSLETKALLSLYANYLKCLRIKKF